MRIYWAANLFDWDNKLYNLELEKELAKFWHKTILPQRDWFEFSKLSNTLSQFLPSEQVQSALNAIIRFLDLWVFLPKSDLVVAKLNEPLDPWVDIEQVYARMMNIPVIWYRTDSRQPYWNNWFNWTHPFPAMETDYFINVSTNWDSLESIKVSIEKLANRISEIIDSSDFVANKIKITKSTSTLQIQRILTWADILFSWIDIKDIHSQNTIELICSRYKDNMDAITVLWPKVYTIS